jgi:septal ring-binding cell division protein DamX
LTHRPRNEYPKLWVEPYLKGWNMKKTDAVGKTKKENRLEKVVVFLLVVLISLLSFSVGVISGKGLSDKEYALKTLDTKYSTALNTDGAAAKDEADENDLSEEEIQQLANAAIQAAQKSGTASVAVKEEGGDAAKTEKKAPAVAKSNAKTKPTPFGNVAVKGDEERVPSSVSKVGAALEYTVQVASYPNPKDAESLAASYVKKDSPLFHLK